MKWLLIDNLIPNKHVLINLSRVDDISWANGILAFEYSDGQTIEYKCERSVFIDVASSLAEAGELKEVEQ